MIVVKSPLTPLFQRGEKRAANDPLNYAKTQKIIEAMKILVP